MLSQLEKYGAPDALVPIHLDELDGVKKKVAWLHEKFGFKRFCLAGLTKGHRATGYPTREEYLRDAEKFAEARAWIKSQELSVGWFCCLTVKSGTSEFSPVIKPDGSEHPFANCPQDSDFAERLSSDIASYASVAKPDFIFLEDDFSVSAAQGCFCDKHLSLLAEKCGKRYAREELVGILEREDAEAIAVRRAFCEVKRETLVSLSARIRAEMDKLTPEIPMGIMQSGSSYLDGDSAEAIARALAGEDHTPFIRLYGANYCGFKAKAMPDTLFNLLYETQHIGSDILRYHETDCYPHMRYYTTGTELCALAAAAYSYGAVGSIFFAQQFLDLPFEEDAYGKRFVREQKRLEALCSLAKDGEVIGAKLAFDPFYTTSAKEGRTSDFAECIGRFGIPFTTKRANVAFLDEKCARYSDEEQILDYLSRGLILDGDAARVLCERGFGKYLGVSVGESLLKKNPRLTYDLGAVEIITEGFALDGLGREMHPAHAFCPAGGREWLEITVTDEKTEVVTEERDFRGNLLSPAMTYFENSLGGRVCVISQGMRDNHSQSVYNYRRRELLQNIIAKMSDEYPFVKGAPDVYLIASRRGGDTLLTLINLCTDDAENLRIYLPESMRGAKEILTVNADGALVSINAEVLQDGMKLCEPLRYCVPTYILIKN